MQIGWSKELDDLGVAIVILPKSHRKIQRLFDRHMYKWRHLIENYFCKLKKFTRIALRSDKLDTSFTSMIYLCASVINSQHALIVNV
ncbi:transposase [Acinetobacter sp. B10A]|nr:transposase [Acinetobacter baretiae]